MSLAKSPIFVASKVKLLFLRLQKTVCRFCSFKGKFVAAEFAVAKYTFAETRICGCKCARCSDRYLAVVAVKLWQRLAMMFQRFSAWEQGQDMPGAGKLALSLR